MAPKRKAASPRKSPEASGAPKPMTAEGRADGTVAGKGNQVRVATEFLKHSASEKWGQVWEEVPEAEVEAKAPTWSRDVAA